MMADNSLLLNERSSSSSSTMSGRVPKTILARMFSPCFVGSIKFIIMDCPLDSTVDEYLKELRLQGVGDVVRVCTPSYAKAPLENAGIKVHDWPFADGTTPPTDILATWLALCTRRFGSLSLSPQQIAEKTGTSDQSPVIAIHCVAGLGRAPVMVCVALIEAGLEPLDAVAFVRKCRRGALNSHQLQFLVDTYKRRSTKRLPFFSKQPVSPTKTTGHGSKIVDSLSRVFRFIKPNTDDSVDKANGQVASKG